MSCQHMIVNKILMRYYNICFEENAILQKKKNNNNNDKKENISESTKNSAYLVLFENKKPCHNNDVIKAGSIDECHHYLNLRYYISFAT